MDRLHFLDVGQGDCSIIQHRSGRTSMIDVYKARLRSERNALIDLLRDQSGEVPSPLGSYLSSAWSVNHTHQSTNPIEYLKNLGVTNLFRFILTHPDMDHMDGIKALFDAIPVFNLWDTRNTKTFESHFRYSDDDWKYYLALRDGMAAYGNKRLTLCNGARGAPWNDFSVDFGTPDNLHVLAPTPDLIEQANKEGNWNDASYVIVWFTPAGRVLFWGDAHDRTRQHVLEHYAQDLKGVEIMIAPHHGRDSGGSKEFLSRLQPKLTLFGRAPSEHMAYSAWSGRNLPIITNNQAGNIVIDMSGDQPVVYAQNQRFAVSQYGSAVWSESHGGYLCGGVERSVLGNVGE